MPKRKRSEIEEVIDNIEDRATRIEASRLQTKIDHGNKSLKAALNLARGFERQKLGRRQKKASNEPHTLLRLREEVIILKELDIGNTAKDYLLKQLIRTKRIREAPAFTAIYGENAKTEPPKSNAEANVLGRLFKANPVQEVVPGIMSEIKRALNLGNGRTTNVNGNVVANHSEAEQFGEKERVAPKADSHIFEKVLDENNHETGATSNDEEEPELKACNARIAGSSDEDEDEDRNGGNANDELDPMEISEEEEVEGEDRDGESLVSLSLSDASMDEASNKKMEHKRPSTNVASTSFLPSLSMGGYYSGSESEDGNFNDRSLGPAIPLDRKNRRGQRARQKIAELKYGQSAKHLQKHQTSKDSRNTGWDTRRGAVNSGKENQKQRRFGRGMPSRRNGPTGANGEAVVDNRTSRRPKTGAKKPDGPIHPSWEAAKKRKEESGKIAFAGKKVTFD